MPLFVADCDLPGMTPETLVKAQGRAIAVSRALSAQGTSVRYVRAVWIPEDWRVLWFFEAAEADLVRAVQETAQIPYLRVIEACDVALLPQVQEADSLAGVDCATRGQRREP